MICFRSEDANVISGMASLKTDDVQFLKLKRLELFEGFMYELDWNLSPGIVARRKEEHGLKNEVVCVNGRQQFKFALFDLP